MSAQPASGPVPQGLYLAARRHGDLVYTSGMTPRRAGVLTSTGKIGAADPLDGHQDAVVLATSNALTAARNLCSEHEAVSHILSMTVFIAAKPDFQQHSKLADYASQYLLEELGAQAIGSRAAVGVASLPSDAPVEIQLVAVISITP